MSSEVVYQPYKTEDMYDIFSESFQQLMADEYQPEIQQCLQDNNEKEEVKSGTSKKSDSLSSWLLAQVNIVPQEKQPVPDVEIDFAKVEEDLEPVPAEIPEEAIGNLEPDNPGVEIANQILENPAQEEEEAPNVIMEAANPDQPFHINRVILYIGDLEYYPPEHYQFMLYHYADHIHMVHLPYALWGANEQNEVHFLYPVVINTFYDHPVWSEYVTYLPEGELPDEDLRVIHLEHCTRIHEQRLRTEFPAHSEGVLLVNLPDIHPLCYIAARVGCHVVRYQNVVMPPPGQPIFNLNPVHEAQLDPQIPEDDDIEIFVDDDDDNDSGVF